MATLTGKTIASTYTSLLKLEGDAGSAVASSGTNAVQVKTGDDEATPIYLNTDRVGINTAGPDGLLDISNNDSNPVYITSYHDTGTNYGALCIRKADGTEGSPTTIDNNEVLGAIIFQGWTNAFQTGAAIEAKAADAPGTGTDMPTDLNFYTATDGAVVDLTATPQMTILSDGKVGIGTAPAYLLEAAGDSSGGPVCRLQNTHGTNPSVLILDTSSASSNDTTNYFIKFEDAEGVEGYVYSDGTHVALSDIRRKENIIDTPSQLDDVNKIRVINYNRKNDKSEHLHIGVIAQELEEIYPHLVTTSDDEMEHKMVYKTGIFAILIKAVQELSAKVTALENA